MSTEEQRQKEAERKRLYRKRKAEEKAAQAPGMELREASNPQARDMAPGPGRAYMDDTGPSGLRPVHTPPTKEIGRAADGIHASAVESVMEGYRKDFSNANAMLRHILYHLVSVDTALSGRTAR